MQLNKIYLSDFLENTLSAECARLIIADPPYFETKGGFDFIWKSFDDYLEDVEIWAKECKRLLAPNGTLIWWGDRKKIAYSQIILDKYFNLEESCVWEKIETQTKRVKASDALSFINVTERFLMYSNEVSQTGLDRVLSTCDFSILMNYLKEERQKAGWTYSQCDEYLNIKASYCYWDKHTTHAYRIPEKRHYLKLQETGFWQKPYEQLRQEYEQLRQEYEQLRQEYEQLRRPFNVPEKYKTNVIKARQEAEITKKYKHPTQKPPFLCRLLVDSMSKEGDLIVVPFAGSGSECEAAKVTGRQFIGFDIDKEHVKTANDRVNKAECLPKLF